MNTKLFSYAILTFSSGLSMWILAGLWHNLILPLVNQNIEAHHEGLVTMLIAYFILAFLMVYLFEISNKENKYLL